MRTWLAVLAVGAGSYAFRALPMLVLARGPVSPTFERTVRHAGVAAVTALLVGSVRHAAEGGEPAAVLGAVAAGSAAALRGASALVVLAVGALAYGAALVVGSAVNW